MNLRGPSSQRTNRILRSSHGLQMPPGATRSSSSATQHEMPPGATRSTSSATQHPLPSLAAVMGAPERRNMPHLHPQKLNGALWFEIDDCIRKDIVATWQSNFWGPWWTFKMVPLDKKDAWWTCFVQKYYWEQVHHNMVLHHWTEMCKDSIRNLVSKRRRSGKKPDYIGVTDWGQMLDAWAEESSQKRSKTNSKNRLSDPDGLGTHCHVSEAKKHKRVAYEMALEAGGVEPAATEVVRKTHTRNGTFIDKRAEKFVLAAENLASQRVNDNNETGDSSVTAPTPHLLTAAYIEMASNNKGHVYGLGSIQNQDVEANESAATALRRNLDADMRMTKLEENVDVVKRTLEVILRLNGVDPVTLQPHAEAAASAASPLGSDSVIGPPQCPQPNQTSPINLARHTPQSVEGFDIGH